MSQLSGLALVQQTITASEHSTVRDVTQKAEVHQALPVYFQLVIWDDEAEADDFGDQSVNQLAPNKRYMVEVRTTFDEQPTQMGIYVQSPLDLLLKVEGKGVAETITIANPRTTLSLQQASNAFTHEFELQTANQLPHGQVTLTLLYKRQDVRRAKPETAVTHQLSLAGTYNPVDHSLLQKCHVNLAQKRPLHTAIIHIENAGSTGQLRLTCWGYHANRTLTTAPFTPPNVSLADFIEAQADPLTVLGKLRTFSSDNPDLELNKWINLLRFRLGNELQVVIIDHTDSEIPWEMLELEDGVYLGAIVPVARWLPIPYYDEYIQIQVKAEDRIGRVMAYLDREELHTTVEEQMLNHFDTRFQPDAQQLQTQLEQSLEDIGLIYLGCHGIFATDSMNQAAYGSWHNPGNRLIPLQLELLRFHETLRPLLFVNACHSARVTRDGWSLHGLPIAMLKRIASGYIGTLGPVNSTHASQIAAYILQAIRDTATGAQPVELLRQLRATAAHHLRNNLASRENQLRFIYTFMYIYYGNPLTQLRLLPAPTTGEDDD